MRWVIFALGVALALGGAASIVAGVPYIRIESGWTEVIAGTTALSAGIVTLGLGAVLNALRNLERRLVEGNSSAAPDVPGFALPPAEQMALPLVATGLPSDDADVVLPSAAEHDVPPAPASRPLMGRVKSKLSTMGTPANDRADPLVPVEPVPGTGRSSAASSAQRDRDETSALRQPEENALDLTPRRSYARPSAAALTRGETDDRVPSLIPSSQHIAAESVSGTLEAPTVVGRYESGGATYVLFSDGTIEVETETGTHRFASMEELKAYIDQQDASSVS